eukprot:TRINITY_DN21946_c0_g1_i1.p1 TRINITY_DN21946_c0_g1~~TRINITY_DN21946_c0_g1_i1.p1  ORF type:complete len:133 (-),score=32.29 TRINITY_DN21946_c0_g1_i1:17-415(-)
MEESQPKGRQVIDVVLPTYVMKPAEDEVFYPAKAKAISEKIVKAELGGKEYDEQEAKEWSLNIADAIREQIKQLSIPRYKVVVQVTVGQMKDQGVRVASRCLWDTATDNYASVNYKTQSLWCNVMCFGIYTE